MEKEKFKISTKRFSGESVVLSVRIPKDMLVALDDVAKITGRTRNEIANLCLEYALENLEIDSSQANPK